MPFRNMVVMVLKTDWFKFKAYLLNDCYRGLQLEFKNSQNYLSATIK